MRAYGILGAFAVLALHVFLLPHGPAEEDEAEPYQVVVDGRHLIMNGAARIPKGMFGTHNVPLNDERIHEWGIASERAIVQQPNATPRTPGNGFHADLQHYIECLYDRYHPALQLMNPDGWEEHLRTIAHGYGVAARETGFQHRVEFWNEPYLNWASRPGVNWDPRFYEREGVQEGDRVTIRGQSEPTEYLIWRQGHFLERANDNRPNDILDYVRGGNFLRDPFSDSMMRGVAFGEPFEFQGRHLVAKPKLVPYDPTQWERENTGNRWWSGQQNRVWYQQMLLAYGEALKEANPDVQFAAGWGFHFSQAGWLAWRELYEPVLDAAIHVVDAVHEHHYGGDTRMVAANYEVVWNWGVARHNKALEFWNTEAAGQLDPQRPDVVHTGSHGSGIERARGSATYTLRDIIYLLQWMPDRATARAAHHAHHNGGDEFAFRLLRDLRGEMLSTSTSRREVWSVASRSDDDHLVLVLFNDEPEVIEVSLDVQAPQGYSITDSGQLRRIIERKDGEGLTIAANALPNQGAAGWTGTVYMEPKSALAISWPLAEEAHSQPHYRHVRHIPASDILRWVNPDSLVEMQVALSEEDLTGATAAYLRLAMINYQGEGGVVQLNDHQESLHMGNWMHRQPIALEALQPDSTLSFQSLNEDESYGIWAAAIELIYDDE